MSDQRDIRFKFAVDAQSMGSVERALDQLIRKSQELAKSLNSVSIGGAGGGLLSGKVGKSGSGPSKPGGGPQSQTSFVGVMASQASAFQKLAQDSTSSMRAMGDSVSRGVSSQQSEINRLKNSLDDLAKTYVRAGNAAGTLSSKTMPSAAGTLSSKTMPSAARAGYFSPAGTGLLPGIPYPTAGGGMTGMFSPVNFTMQNQAQGMAALMGQMGAQGGFAGGAGLGGLFAGARGGLNAIGGASLPAGAQQALSMLPGGALMARMANPATALAMAGVWAATSAARGVYDAPIFESRIAGDIVSGRDSYARKLRVGDTSDMRALARIQADPVKRANMEAMQGTGGAGLFSTMWEGKDAGYGKWTNRAAMVALGPLALLNSPTAMREAGIRGGAAWEAGSGGHFATAFNALTGDRTNPIIGKQTDAALKETINAEIRAEGLRDEIIAEGYANARSSVGFQRAMGIGSGRKRDKTGKPIAGTYVSNAEIFAANYNMFSQEELVAASTGITAAGGRRSRFGKEGMFDSVLQATAAQMTGMAHFGGVFGREGGTRGRDMVDIARTLAAQSDVGTASLISDYAAKQQDQMLMANAVGAGTLGVLSYGTDAPAGALVARQNILGMASMDKVYSGDRDAWQKAANLSAVISAAPGANYYAQQYMATNLTAARTAELEAGRPLTEEERGNFPGMSEEEARQQLVTAGRGIRQTSAYRVATTGFTPGSKQQKWAEAMQKPGFIASDAALKMFGGEDMKWSDAEREEYFQVAGLVRSKQTGEGYAASKGAVRDEFALGREAVKGKGVGDTSAGSRAAVELRTEAEVKKKDLAQQDAFTEETDRQKKELATAYQSLLGQSGNIAAVSKSIAEILLRHAKELTAIEKAFGPAKAGAPSGKTVTFQPKQ